MFSKQNYTLFWFFLIFLKSQKSFVNFQKYDIPHQYRQKEQTAWPSTEVGWTLELIWNGKTLLLWCPIMFRNGLGLFWKFGFSDHFDQNWGRFENKYDNYEWAWTFCFFDLDTSKVLRSYLRPTGVVWNIVWDILKKSPIDPQPIPWHSDEIRGRDFFGPNTYLVKFFLCFQKCSVWWVTHNKQ